MGCLVKNNQNCLCCLGSVRICNTYTTGNAMPTQIKKLLLFTPFFLWPGCNSAQLDQKNIEKKRSTVVDLPLGPCCWPSCPQWIGSRSSCPSPPTHQLIPLPCCKYCEKEDTSANLYAKPFFQYAGMRE